MTGVCLVLCFECYVSICILILKKPTFRIRVRIRIRVRVRIRIRVRVRVRVKVSLCHSHLPLSHSPLPLSHSPPHPPSGHHSHTLTVLNQQENLTRVVTNYTTKCARMVAVVCMWCTYALYACAIVVHTRFFVSVCVVGDWECEFVWFT